MDGRALVLVIILTVLLAGCSRVAHPTEVTPIPEASATATGTLGSTPPPAGPAIAAVSRSNPTLEAAEVLRVCLNETIPVEQVDRMGLIPSARDLPRYVPLTGRELEIQTDAPAWIVGFVGEIPMLLAAEVWIDPFCVVIDGQRSYFATGPVKNLRTGALSTPEPPASPPDRALPTLAP